MTALAVCACHLIVHQDLGSRSHESPAAINTHISVASCLPANSAKGSSDQHVPNDVREIGPRKY